MSQSKPKSLPSPDLQLQVLTAAEQRDLDRIESRIAAGLSAFFEVAYALMEIKKRRLYRVEFTTFEEYCRKRWDMQRGHAYRLITAAEICQKLSPMGDIPLPENERQIRPLTGLARNAAEKAWKRAYEKAGAEGKITGALVQQAVNEITRRHGRLRKALFKENWQIRIAPMLEEALILTKSGNKEGLSEIIERVQLLLLIGHRKARPDGLEP